MRAVLRRQVLVGLGAAALCGSVIGREWTPSPASSMSIPVRAINRSDASPSDRSLREAQWFRMQAQKAVNLEREALEAAEPEQTQALDQEAWRRRLIARDPDGVLRSARAAARRGLQLARTPREAYRATLLLNRIVSDLGDYKEELQLARSLVRLAPHNPLSLMYLRQAAEHNALPDLARWAYSTLDALPVTPHPDEPTW
jgi:hypothetical protein